MTDTTRPGDIELTANDLCGRHLGTPVTVVDPRTHRLVLGDLTSVEHSGLDRHRVWLRVDADGWQWRGLVPADAPIILHPAREETDRDTEGR